MHSRPHGLCVAPAAAREMVDLAPPGAPDDAIEALMDAETWFSAEEARQNGFVDHVDTPIEAAAHDLSKFKYRHPPQPSPADIRGKIIAARFPTRQASR